MREREKEREKKMNNTPFVTLCTPTFNRRPFIPMMLKCFENQTYPKSHMEWIIVDDGTDKVGDLLQNVPQIRYFEYKDKMTLGKKRNICNSLATGSILIYIDDDDYYPPERVSHAVHKLLSAPKDTLIAGSSEMYFYFTDIQKMYTFGPYGKLQATAATFAFKKELLQQTCFSEDSSVDEEKFFLKNRTLPMVQLDPRKTILVFAHDHNSFSKKKLLEDYEKYGNGVHLHKETYVQVEDFIQDSFIYNFFMRDMQELLSKYEQGKVIYKPDVLKQMNEKMEKRESQKQYFDLVSANKMPNNNNNNEKTKYERKINDLTLMISQLLQENKDLRSQL